MGEALIRKLLVFYLQVIEMDENAQHIELEFIEVLKNFEASRNKWLHTELELKRHKELLLKSDVARAALEVKLKHARNQVDVEIKKRYKAEADYQYLPLTWQQRQMQLMCDILVHDSKSSACLNDEQRSMLANLNHRGASVTQHKSRRLSVIDESSFLSHSDISYDRTDDELDLDSTAIKPLKSRAREKRRSSMGPGAGKRGRGLSGDLLGGRPMEKDVEPMIVKTSVTTPESGGQIHMVIDITQETPEKPPRKFRQETVVSSVCEQTSVWDTNDETIVEPDTIAEMEEETTTIEPKPSSAFTTPVQKRHIFLSKTVIRPEMCVPCGKRIRFGKTAVKCRDCRLVAHPECKLKCLDGCSSSLRGPHGMKDTLESFAPATQPRIPLLIVQCVNEIERRGLEEKGIYRVPGGERMVKELREKYILRKAPLVLSRVDEIHVVCGLLKDFLRKLNEPLITFRLHRTFMEAAEMSDDDNSAAIMYQAIGDLPRANRDTLSFLMLHLQKVMQSPLCQMDQNNLARVFGPTIVGHGMAEPSPMTIMKDTNTQPKVITRMLSFSAEYWKRFLAEEREQVISSVVDANINGEGRSVDRGKRVTPTAPKSKAKTNPGKKFFTSPTC